MLIAPLAEEPPVHLCVDGLCRKASALAAVPRSRIAAVVSIVTEHENFTGFHAVRRAPGLGIRRINGEIGAATEILDGQAPPHSSADDRVEVGPHVARRQLPTVDEGAHPMHRDFVAGQPDHAFDELIGRVDTRGRTKHDDVAARRQPRRRNGPDGGHPQTVGPLGSGNDVLGLERRQHRRALDAIRTERAAKQECGRQGERECRRGPRAARTLGARAGSLRKPETRRARERGKHDEQRDDEPDGVFVTDGRKPFRPSVARLGRSRDEKMDRERRKRTRQRHEPKPPKDEGARRAHGSDSH